MITRVTLADLKQKIAAASPPPLVVAAMDSRGTRFQLSTPRPTARVVGNVFSKADAECIAALWVWGQRLIEEVERSQTVAGAVANIHDATPLLSERLAGTGAIVRPELMEKGIPRHRKKAKTPV